MQRRASGLLARHEWKPRLFGPEYSSDNAGDGPRDRKKVKADCEEEKDLPEGMSQRDKALMLAHIAAVRTQNSEGGNWRFEPTRHQFCRKLAEFRASKSRTVRYVDIEQYIQHHPFVDQHCISEPPRSDVFRGNNPYMYFADTMESELYANGILFTTEALEDDETGSKQVVQAQHTQPNVKSPLSGDCSPLWPSKSEAEILEAGETSEQDYWADCALSMTSSAEGEHEQFVRKAAWLSVTRRSA